MQAYPRSQCCELSLSACWLWLCRWWLWRTLCISDETARGPPDAALSSSPAAAWSLTARSSWARCDSLHLLSSWAIRDGPPVCITRREEHSLAFRLMLFCSNKLTVYSYLKIQKVVLLDRSWLSHDDYHLSPS
jgi:hypothetical protein